MTMQKISVHLPEILPLISDQSQGKRKLSKFDICCNRGAVQRL